MKIESIHCTHTHEEQFDPTITTLTEGICGYTAFRSESSFHGVLSSPVTEKIVTARELMLHPVTKLSLECLFVKENNLQ